MTWLCTAETRYSNGKTCIVTGPNMDIAIKLIKQTKALFENNLGLMFQNKETVIELYSYHIKGQPIKDFSYLVT
jgi:hypothetical protein